jgi:hypothetical protein
MLVFSKRVFSILVFSTFLIPFKCIRQTWQFAPWNISGIRLVFLRRAYLLWMRCELASRATWPRIQLETTMESDDLREKLAEYAHAAWSGWMLHLFDHSKLNEDGSANIPAWAVRRWTRQANASYQELLEDEKNSDRAEADAMLGIVREYRP